MLWTCRRRDKKVTPFLTVPTSHTLDFLVASVARASTFYREDGLEGLASYTASPFHSPAGGSHEGPGVYHLRELTGQPKLHFAK